VCLRPPQDEDAAAYFAIGRDADIGRMFGVDRTEAMMPFQEVEATAWLDRIRENPYAWIIELHASVRAGVEEARAGAKPRHVHRDLRRTSP
jgi:hypothetical protein